MANRIPNQRGVALLLAIFALLIITSLALSAMFSTGTENAINSNFRDEQSAYYAAKAGVEEARDRMRPSAGATISSKLPTVIPGSTNGALYILNPTGSETVAPWDSSNAYYDAEICKEVSCSGGYVPYISPAPSASTTYASTPALPYKWMRITLKTNASASGWSGATQNFYYVNSGLAAGSYVCWNGTNEFASAAACTAPNSPVYQVTSLAVTNSGTRRMVQSEVTQPEQGLTFPGALTLDGTGDSMAGPNSNPFTIQGADHNGCGSTTVGSSVPAIAVDSTADQSAVKAGIPSNRWGNYTGSDATLPPGTTPDIEVATMPAGLQSVAALQSLVASVEANATQTYTGTVTNLANPGTASSPQIIVVNGDLTLSGNTTGYGILLVTGTYTTAGTVGWNGLVLVIGKGIVIGSGGGTNPYYGAMVVAQTVDRTTGAALTTLGSPTFNWSGGGGNGIYYSSGCLNQAINLISFKVITSHELED